MGLENNTSRSLYIIAKRQGYDPGAIVGEGNLVPTPDNINAYTGIPDGNKPVKQMGPPDMGPSGIPEIGTPSDPEPGK